MSDCWPGRGGLDYKHCAYGDSRLSFRGPQRAFDAPYCAVMGGTETFGKFVANPYPALTEDRTGLRMVNFGSPNAGLDAFLQDETVLSAARDACAVVIQIGGAQNLSNAYYSVHPRRNDRFLRASAALQRLYPEVDFTEFSFTGHLLQSLLQRGPKRFARVRAVLQATWCERMRELLSEFSAPVLALRVSGIPLSGRRAVNQSHACELVTEGMLTALKLDPSAVIEIVFRAGDDAAAMAGMTFAPVERAAARALPGPEAHERAAQALSARLCALAVTCTEASPAQSGRAAQRGSAPDGGQSF
jgi:hypothetical protein